MLRHIVMWNFKDGFTREENQQNAEKIKRDLEALAKEIPGIKLLEVIIAPLASSNRDVALNSLFENEEALANYQTHPEHVKAGVFIGKVMVNRTCIDYFE